MDNELEPLPSGLIRIGDVQVEVTGLVGRVGDGLVYEARTGGHAVRLREYAPAGIVRRRSDGGLEPAQARFAAAWSDAAARFLAQAEHLAALDDENVAEIERALAVEADGVRTGDFSIGVPAGSPLAAQLVPDRALAAAQVLQLASELADALAEIHGAGLTHLDIAPETVAIRAGSLQLTDFAIDNRAFMPLLGSQDGLVRPGYSPIEHHDATLAEPLGPPADVHAASALLYRLITGRAPMPWQERWRDLAAAELPAVEGYPPAFLAAVRKGMAIEPGDRFADGIAWRAALGLAGGPEPETALIRRGNPPPPPGRPLPPPVQDAPPQHKVAAGHWLLPLAIALGVILAAIAAYLAYTRWIAPARQQQTPTPGNTITIPPQQTPPPIEPPVSTLPAIQIGSSVSGQLSDGDTRRGSGQFQDSFTLDAQGGERIEIGLSSPDFDPVLAISGPGLSESNDDDFDSDTRDSRLVVTLPRPGRYTITASSYDRDERGVYQLSVKAAAAEPAGGGEVSTIDLGVAARLAGRWHGTNDPECDAPAVNRIDGDALVSSNGAETFRHRILTAGRDEIETEIVAGRLSGRRFTFRIGAGDKSYTVAGETWTRC